MIGLKCRWPQIEPVVGPAKLPLPAWPPPRPPRMVPSLLSILAVTDASRPRAFDAYDARNQSAYSSSRDENASAAPYAAYGEVVVVVASSVEVASVDDAVSDGANEGALIMTVRVLVEVRPVWSVAT